MKLTNFYNFAPFNALKERMGIARDVYGAFSVGVRTGRLTPVELEKLTTGDGIDVSFEEIMVLEDGTLAYKNSRVFLYIRDVHPYGHKISLPRYHLANCQTLQNMVEAGRFAKYVISTRIDGQFSLNLIYSQRAKNELRPLDVCQNCLDKLRFDGFEMQLPRPRRRNIVEAFTPARFFEKYSRDLHIVLPVHDAITAPLNVYPDNFSDISHKFREAAKWHCQECRRNFSAPKLRRYLHLHHVSGVRSNNHPTNLMVLCIVCHSKQPGHGRMTGLPEYVAFRALIRQTKISE